MIWPVLTLMVLGLMTSAFHPSLPPPTGAPAPLERSYPGGGAGQPIGGIECLSHETFIVHTHTRLHLFVNDHQIVIPALIGIVHLDDGGWCFYYLHTHGLDGIIHVEAPHAGFAFGDFLKVWGLTADAYHFGPYRGMVTETVDGRPYTGDINVIPLSGTKNITVMVSATQDALASPTPGNGDASPARR